MKDERVEEDRAYMRRAIELADRGWGRVHPNPLVGAVVVRDGVVVGEGYHAEYGGPHAEVVALEQAGEAARGATVYVTLEPCTHQGKTPPCTLALRRAGIARLVYGAEDTNPKARGGAEQLRQAGIAVHGGVEREAVRAQNAMFFHAVERGSTYVALKFGLTLDARIAEMPGWGGAVTGPESHAEVHRLRAGFDAILVGIGTALADDPQLTVRGAVVPRTPPRRIVLDAAARLPLDSKLARTAADVPVWLFCAEDASAERRAALQRAGLRILTVPRGPAGLELEPVLDRLWTEGIRSVLCEGGAQLGASLLAADRVQRLYLFLAPRLFGERGVLAFPGRFPPQVADGWEYARAVPCGRDLLAVLDRRRSEDVPYGHGRPVPPDAAQSGGRGRGVSGAD